MKTIFDIGGVNELIWELSRFLDRTIIESKQKHYTEEDAMRYQLELYKIIIERFKVKSE